MPNITKSALGEKIDFALLRIKQSIGKKQKPKRQKINHIAIKNASIQAARKIALEETKVSSQEKILNEKNDTQKTSKSQKLTVKEKL